MPSRFALTLAATLTIAVGAHTADARESKRLKVRSVSVAYSDLDLAKETDAQIMLERLERAAYLACGRNPQMHPAHSLMPHYISHIYSECRAEAVAKAVATLKAPLLSLALEGRTENKERG